MAASTAASTDPIRTAALASSRTPLLLEGQLGDEQRHGEPDAAEQREPGHVLPRQLRVQFRMRPPGDRIRAPEDADELADHESQRRCRAATGSSSTTKRVAVERRRRRGRTRTPGPRTPADSGRTRCSSRSAGELVARRGRAGPGSAGRGATPATVACTPLSCTQRPDRERQWHVDPGRAHPASLQHRVCGARPAAPARARRSARSSV